MSPGGGTLLKNVGIFTCKSRKCLKLSQEFTQWIFWVRAQNREPLRSILTPMPSRDLQLARTTGQAQDLAGVQGLMGAAQGILD